MSEKLVLMFLATNPATSVSTYVLILYAYLLTDCCYSFFIYSFVVIIGLGTSGKPKLLIADFFDFYLCLTNI